MRAITFFLFSLLFMGCAGVEITEPPQKQDTAQTKTIVKTVQPKLFSSNAATKKILIIHSYHQEMEWVQEINNGISTALRKRIGTDIETQYFYMDTKRKTTDKWKTEISQKARELIKDNNPDIIITSDDNATNYIAGQMRNSKYQFVFLGVNSEPHEYGFPAKNVTGFLEHEDFIQTANLLKENDPRIEKVAFIADKSPSTEGLEQRVLEQKDHIPMEIVAVERISNFSTWQQAVQKYQTQSDCLIIGHYHTIKDSEGETIPAPKVMEWTLKNSKVPEGSFWAFSINQGAFCAITVSGYQHGYQAAKRALEIVDNSKNAGDFAIKTIRKGQQMINTTRAKQLGLQVPKDILNNSRVIEQQTALD
ncbi:ABC transporter substrate-binding protein [Candidatus Uabimicrobium amorphum]|uniref:ABC transporter substrate-binding protein n=1 Tax=Uabimicrobium amorphum TaxID=2596890 RepID=A0A5S9F677_UABAM|nr:ABC transporter substrate binding protein [Candidatus Uabimicrobium amorphum]BBM87392.1 hypothetical protein UABAM_05801 [Candidatus Uabimicrobium amorphum]